MNLSLIWNRYLWLPLETWNQGVRGGPFPWTPTSLGVRPLAQPSKEISSREAWQQAPTINSPAFSQKYWGAWEVLWSILEGLGEMFWGKIWGGAAATGNSSRGGNLAVSQPNLPISGLMPPQGARTKTHTKDHQPLKTNNFQTKIDTNNPKTEPAKPWSLCHHQLLSRQQNSGKNVQPLTTA